MVHYIIQELHDGDYDGHPLSYFHFCRSYLVYGHICHDEDGCDHDSDDELPSDVYCPGRHDVIFIYDDHHHHHLRNEDVHVREREIILTN